LYTSSSFVSISWQLEITKFSLTKCAYTNKLCWQTLQFLQVPLTVTLTWIYASFLTAGGGYNYKGCNPNIPSSNILIGACRKHAYTMKHCRTDISNALLTSAWLRILYPLQWGFPIFHFRTCIMMAIVSLAASVDSVSILFWMLASAKYHLLGIMTPTISRIGGSIWYFKAWDFLI